MYYYYKTGLSCFLFSVSALFSYSQAAKFYIKSDGVEQYVNADPNTMKVLYWTIEVYPQDRSTFKNRPWGAIIGGSYQDVLKQLKECQQQDEEHAKLFDKNVTDYNLNYLHPKGPIAILSKSNQTEKRTESAKVISEFNNLNDRYSDYITAKQVFGIYDDKINAGIYPDALFRDVGITFKEYTDLLVDANARLMKLGVTINDFISRGFDKISKEIDAYNQFLQNEYGPKSNDYLGKINGYKNTAENYNSSDSWNQSKSQGDYLEKWDVKLEKKKFEVIYETHPNSNRLYQLNFQFKIGDIFNWQSWKNKNDDSYVIQVCFKDDIIGSSFNNIDGSYKESFRYFNFSFYDESVMQSFIQKFKDLRMKENSN